MLDPLGVTQTEERVYRCLLRDPAAPQDDLALAVGIGRPRLRKVLSSLEAKGMVSRSAERSPRYVAVAPDAAVEGLIKRRQEEFELTRSYAAQLLKEYRSPTNRSGNPADFVEVVSGREGVAHRFMQIQQGASKELLIFDKPPYAQPINDDGFERLEQGLRYRTVYSRDALTNPGRLDIVRNFVRAGEEARISPDLPMKMAIADHRVAMIPLVVSAPTEVDSAVVIHSLSMLDALVALFEKYWSQALPLSLMAEPKIESEGDAADHPTDEPLLTLLAAGLTDEVIARQLSISTRTVGRRVRRLMEDLSVGTRFQAGLQAARRGWL